MDPQSAAALVGLLTNGGPWAVVVVVLGLVLRAWRSGDFISKAVHDAIAAVLRERYNDLLDRLKNAQEAIIEWRTAAERAAKAAEQAQERQKEVLQHLSTVRGDLQSVATQIRELRDDLRDGGAVPDRRERPPVRRPGGVPREGG